jgi:hypothetical protein
MSNTTWRKLITDEMVIRGDAWSNVVGIAPDDAALTVEFDDGYGCTEGPPFTVWTIRFVYFPICYDGAESCGSVSRNPIPEPQEHQGGG